MSEESNHCSPSSVEQSFSFETTFASPSGDLLSVLNLYRQDCAAMTDAERLKEINNILSEEGKKPLAMLALIICVMDSYI